MRTYTNDRAGRFPKIFPKIVHRLPAKAREAKRRKGPIFKLLGGLPVDAHEAQRS